MIKDRQTNRLAKEKSPYLLQHAYNPVDWFPWGDEAFEKAKAEDKPIFLSVGYSTCHWCHVMERESFEDTQVAEILNRHFVSIKVDREERPDIDSVYMAACQAMTGHGGWPLTIIMTPQQEPFFAGTYFPKTGTHQMPGLIEILRQIQEVWEKNREEIQNLGSRLTETLEKEILQEKPGPLSERVLDQAYAHFSRTFDSQYGGFGDAPKFPMPHNLLFLLRYWKLTGQPKALEMVEKSLESMYRGGIYDHIGLGFSRYSTDRRWLVPHFEKMLYDNALLAMAYGETYQATGKPFYARVVKEIFSYVLRDMTSPEGAFYTAEDADSEGEEGKFYVWTLEEVQKILGPGAKAFCRDYDITLRGNFEGKNIPNLITTGIIQGQEEARKQLFSVREKRTCPFRDDKILTGWNGLMIAALAFNARVLGEPEYALAAEKATHFLLDNLRREDGRLLARYRDGEKAGLALAEDYAFFIWGLLEIFQTTSRAHFLSKALELNSDLIRYFWDEGKGGLYHYGNDGETLIARPKEAQDGALPSANSVAALNFLRLGHLTGNRDLEEKALQQFTTFGGQINSYPQGFAFFLIAIYWYQVPTLEIQVIGEDTRDMLRLINSLFLPKALLITMDPARDQGLRQLIPSLEGRYAINDSTTAYVCRGTACQTPTTDLDRVKELLTR